ncbi:AEC family transporter [Sesbania bispinosa]|nr:AEC family transporter [Sesbania bispinosa]
MLTAGTASSGAAVARGGTRGRRRCLSFQQICNRDGARLEQQDSGGYETPQGTGADMLELLTSVAMTIKRTGVESEGVLQFDGEGLEIIERSISTVW